MTRVEVEYCVPCGMLNRAQDVSEAILKQFGESIDEVVFDKTEDEYDVDAIVRAVKPHVGAAA